jgi:alpha-L-fucosidase 2
MMRMGIWTENLALPAVLNECMLQSYSGVIRLFPNTTNLGKARFRHLRAKGAFLVSAAWDGHSVTEAEIVSEKGAPARLASPWPEPVRL